MPVKSKKTRENSWNFGRETIFLTREKNLKSWRENKKLAVKNPKKVEKSGREKRFLPVKKTGQRAKNGFHAKKKKHCKISTRGEGAGQMR